MNIIVLCGGISTEREVSINSGAMVCAALREVKHNAVLLDVYFGDEDKKIFENSKTTYNIEEQKQKIQKMSTEVKKTKKDRKTFFGHNVIEICQDADIVFMALHGENGEDGKCQAAFDLMGIKYTGTGSLSSGMAMDKGVAKQMFMARNVPTPKGVWIKKGDSTKLSDYKMKIPVVVKACNGGSSLGVVIVKKEEDYDKAVEECYNLEDQIVVEEFVEGREFSISVVDGRALPIVEIIPKNGWYDYKNKYIAGATEDICPADISDSLTEKMKKVAKEACEALRIETYARADIIMDKEGNMYCLEVNSLPGMTPTSLLPQEAKAEGIEFPQLCDNLVRLSLKKYEN